MGPQGRVITLMFVVGVILGVISYFILAYLFTLLFVAYPGIGAEQEMDVVISSGIGAVSFTLMFLFYPIYKHGVREPEAEDFR
ncbi:MAG TPA: hypothetical protein VKU79_07075 [Thermoplasmataceae archaeon]|nr:hypothetical protein [Thermoplasmatales archaeon AK]HLH86607.1 hypothetical protein [Thermoplasmataceae archaeon]